MYTRSQYTAAVLTCFAAINLIALGQSAIGWLSLVTALVISLNTARKFWREFIIIIGAIAILALAPVSTDVSLQHFADLFLPMVSLVLIPYFTYTYIFKTPVINFSLKQNVSRHYWLYFGFIMLLGYLLLPVYLIHSGVYQNWPAATDTSAFIRLFAGTNLLGAWDELFFICTMLVILRRLFPAWVAVAMTSVVMLSFLYELGFRSYGPAIFIFFTVSQGYMYLKTKSLRLVLSIHLGLDLILFFVLINAHQPERFDWFVTTLLVR